MSSDASPTEAVAQLIPLKLYYAVFAGLIMLTGVIVGVSYLNLGNAGFILALGVAAVKAGLVIGYFMRLKYEHRFLSLVFFGAAGLLLVFFALTFFDLGARGVLVREQNTHVLQNEQAAQAEMDRAKAEAAAKTAATKTAVPSAAKTAVAPAAQP